VGTNSVSAATLRGVCHEVARDDTGSERSPTSICDDTLDAKLDHAWDQTPQVIGTV
jgi:hypothetical protein